MKTRNEIIEIIKKGVTEDLDIEITATRKSDNYKTNLLTILGNSDSVESYISEMDEEIHNLIEFSKWEIIGFEYKID